LDYGLMTPATLLFTMVLMFIGASPGSTGGGVKTSTVGVLLATIITKVRSRRQVLSFRRGISPGTVATAVVVFLLGAMVVVGGTMLVVMFEHGSDGGAAARAKLLAESFDVVSAFGTVGLSTGITPELTSSSWWLLSAIMYIGRVGPLTLGLAVAGRRVRSKPIFAEEEVMVG
jgi:trk system potassium uptake protein